MEKVRAFRIWLRRPRTKKRIYAAGVVIVACMVAYRFAMVGAQNRIFVYNPARAALTDGVPATVVTVARRDGALREPLTVKNNHAYVSGARAHLLRAGQRIGDGAIVSVASGIDLDTGMHAVRTRGVSDGLHHVDVPANCYFIPSYAVDRNTVMVLSDGIATPRSVRITGTDADTACVASGLNDGDVVILSKVPSGVKVRVIE